MLLPQLTSATAAPLLPATGAVVLAEQAGFLVAYDAAAELSELEQAGWPALSIVVPEVVDAAVAEKPISSGEVAIAAEKVHVTVADPLIAAVDPAPQATQADPPADEPRPPRKAAPHFLAQMMVERPAVPVGMPAADRASDRAARPAPAAVVPVQRQVLSDAGVVPAVVPDAATSILLRDTAVAKDATPAARPFNPGVIAPSVGAVAIAPPVAQPAPPTAMALPVPMPPAVNEPLQSKANTAVVKRADHVVQAVKWLDPKAGAAAGGDPIDSPFVPSTDTASVGGTARVADGHSTPGLARHVAQQLAVTVTQTAGQPTEIALNPEELGRVRMSMSMTDGILILQINAERPETTELLRRHIDTLAQEFRNMGYSDISFDFGEGRAESKDDRKDGPVGEHVEDATDSHEPSQGVARKAHGALDLRL